MEFPEDFVRGNGWREAEGVARGTRAGRNQEVNTSGWRVQGKKQSDRMVELSESAIRRQVNGETLRVLWRERAALHPSCARPGGISLSFTLRRRRRRS